MVLKNQINKTGLCMRNSILFLTLLFSSNAIAENSVAVDSLLKQYQQESKLKFNQKKGSDLWQKKFVSSNGAETRSCSSCHTANLKVNGKHLKTKKLIEPLAPSVNSKRLTKTKTIKKWFKRNCKWTLGRECTAEEKGHLLTYIQSQ
jgi:hypothetical protein